MCFTLVGYYPDVSVRASFQSIVDYAKMFELFLQASQGGAKRVHHQGKFSSNTPRGRDFRGSLGIQVDHCSSLIRFK